jgi:phage gpG-like protein
LIKTIVAQIRTIFKNNNSVLVTAPTGAAAHNVGGQTIHREIKISVKKKKGSSLANSAKEHLIQKLSQTIALFFDE